MMTTPKNLRSSVSLLAGLLLASACTGTSIVDEPGPDVNEALGDARSTTSRAFTVESTWTYVKSPESFGTIGGTTTTYSIVDLCMGGLVSVDAGYRIVTAAHCLDKAKAFAAFSLANPDSKLTIGDFDDLQITATEVEGKKTTIQLGNLVRHKDYDASAGNHPHDIAYAPVTTKIKSAEVFTLAKDTEVAAMTDETELNFYRQGAGEPPKSYRIFYNAQATAEASDDKEHPIRLYNGMEAVKGSSGGPVFTLDGRLYGTIIGTTTIGTAPYNSATDISDPSIVSFLKR